MMTLDTNERITLGQCFNLAHAEALSKTKEANNQMEMRDYDIVMTKRTLELFHLKRKIEAELVANPKAVAQQIIQKDIVEDI